MDAKGRLAIPTRQREHLLALSGGEIVVTVDTRSPCLLVYPLPSWERIEQDLQNLPALNPLVKNFQRLMCSYAADIQLDSSGRILLPPSLREYAKLTKKVVLAGMGNKLEIWCEEFWVAERDRALAELRGDAPLPDELMNLPL